jgi:hypothetical protein
MLRQLKKIPRRIWKLECVLLARGTKVPARQIGGQRRLLLKPGIINFKSYYVSTGTRTIFAAWKGVDKVLISRRKTTATRIGDRRTRHKDGTREQKICSKYKVKSNWRHPVATAGPNSLSLPGRHAGLEANIEPEIFIVLESRSVRTQVVVYRDFERLAWGWREMHWSRGRRLRWHLSNKPSVP